MKLGAFVCMLSFLGFSYFSFASNVGAGSNSGLLVLAVESDELTEAEAAALYQIYETQESQSK